MDACDGLRVLEVSIGHTASALCGELFAGYGATVIKVESTSGDALRHADPKSPDGVSHLFHLINAGKQSVCVADDAAAAAKQWNELIEWADIIIVDQSASTLLPAQLDASALALQWPTKVVCAISLFGHDSTKKAWLGNELIAEAVSGLMACTGYPDRPPVCCGAPFALHIGALFGFSGIMAAVWERNTSQRGEWLDLSIVDCLICLLGNFIPSLFLSGRSPKRVGNRHVIAAPWNLYPSQDGYIVICTGTGGVGWWEALTRVIERSDLAHDERYDIESKRVARVEEVDRIVSEWTSRYATKEIIERMTRGGIPVSDVKSVADVLRDPHYVEKRAMLVWAPYAKDGADPVSIPVAGLPFKLGTWSNNPVLAPALGKHAPLRRDAPTLAPPSGSPKGARRRPLTGIRILEFGSRTSVPLGGRLLSDLGADVVKIEPPQGDGLRMAGQMIGGNAYMFHINNAGKRSFVVDPKDARGRSLILELATKADIWLENLAPGVVERMGLGYSHLSEINKSIIYCSVNGFGIKSNYGERKAFDSVVQAASGMMHLTGYPDHLPVKVGISASDISAGVALVSAVMGALRLRQLTGSGMHIDLAMADIGMWMTQAAWPEFFFGSGDPERRGNRSALACPHNIFPTLDGYIAIAVQSDHQWQRLVKIFGNAELARDASLTKLEGRLQRVDYIENALAAWTKMQAAEPLAMQLQEAGIPAAAVRNLAEMVNDPDVIRRKLIVEVEHPVAGKMKILGNPIRLSRTPPAVNACAPVLGHHTTEVLADWLGYKADQLDALRDSGVISAAPTSAPQMQGS